MGENVWVNQERLRNWVKPSINEHASTTSDGKTISVHRLVWIKNFGNIPKKFIIHHINFNKKDNRIENLQMVSCKEHRLIHNRHNKLPALPNK